MPLHPARLINVVAVPVDEEPARRPVERKGTLDLEGQFVHVLGTPRAVGRSVYSVDPQGVYLADRAVVDPLDHFLPGRRVAPLKPQATLRFFFSDSSAALNTLRVPARREQMTSP